MTEQKIQKSLLNKANIWTVLIAFISVGGFQLLFNYHDNKINRDDNYIEKFVDCTERLNIQAAELATLKQRITLLEVGVSDIPIIAWQKDLNSKILWISNPYKSKILKPLGIPYNAFINTRGEVMGDDFLSLILKHDSIVIATNRMHHFPEPLPNGTPGTSTKYPVKNNLGIPYGVGGYWMPDDMNYLTH